MNYESKFYEANLCSSHKGWDDMQALFKEVDKELEAKDKLIDGKNRLMLEVMRLLKNGANGAIIETVWSDRTTNTTLWEKLHISIKGKE